MPTELQTPPGASTDPESCELVRAWAAHGGLHCSVNVNVWSEDAEILWGILLSDLARHVADALHAGKRLDRGKTLAKIRSVFDSELNNPTAETRGNFA